MNNAHIEKLNSTISEYNQFKKSRLWDDIASVLDCKEEKAKELAHTHCNMVSFWACLTASGKTDMSYRDFFEKALKTMITVTRGHSVQACNEAGNINVPKDLLCPAIFGFNFKLMYYGNFRYVTNPVELDPERFYQMKIVNSKHFMACYVEDGILKLSDTHHRGTGAPAVGAERVDSDHFSWLMAI